MYLVAIAWLYVVILMTLAEGFAAGGSWLGATATFLLYGLVPGGVALYLIGTPARRAAQRRAAASAAVDPDGAGHAAGDAVAAKREEA
jgi:hypothetical protein